MELSGLESWNSTSDCCHWERVRCHNSQKVTSLDLFHLTPSLAMKTLVKSDVLAPLFHLQTLIFLDISYNGHIQGEIPGVGLANLTNLVRLYMAGNSLIGSLPPQLFSLRRLEYLDVSYNFHGGNVPAQIGNLTNLKFFSLYSNKVSGAIPPSLMHLTSMNDPNSYANNSGLCGMQIKLPCEEIPSKPKQVKEKMVKKSKSSETWFSWEMVVIGYPFGFLSTILALYVTDYFYIA
ncbi:hypothetical protein GH714_005030 [Hevea brasiliensis]|uniref:Leucine-rich repeat-containing N-terminal plant-type domain-containing protein n=1 Tax=Hevea brasiliensis TaxID=3981 RepID=A0A6A6KHG4_HEVBR|nr:hypothetical protein GH714_005030 [Hevea brasiliensis]